MGKADRKRKRKEVKRQWEQTTAGGSIGPTASISAAGQTPAFAVAMEKAIADAGRSLASASSGLAASNRALTDALVGSSDGANGAGSVTVTTRATAAQSLAASSRALAGGRVSLDTEQSLIAGGMTMLTQISDDDTWRSQGLDSK